MQVVDSPKQGTDGTTMRLKMILRIQYVNMIWNNNNADQQCEKARKADTIASDNVSKERMGCTLDWVEWKLLVLHWQSVKGCLSSDTSLLNEYHIMGYVLNV